MKIWYDLAVNKGHETQTIESFNSLLDAQERLEKINKQGYFSLNGQIIYTKDIYCLFIDSWENIENPRFINNFDFIEYK